MKTVPIGNTNAEKWTLKDAKALFKDALDIVQKDKTIVFIGGVAVAQGTYRQAYDYIIKKFDKEIVFNTIKKQISSILEDRIVKGAISGDYNPTMVIFTLKNNFGWVDSQKIEQTIKEQEPKINITIKGSDIELK